MRAVVCGANGAMGKLICDIFGDEVVGKVSIDGANNVPRTFEELGEVTADVVVDFSPQCHGIKKWLVTKKAKPLKNATAPFITNMLAIAPII